MSHGPPARPPRAVALLRLLSLVVAGIVLAGTLTRALVHLSDLSRINHIPGIWVALAQSLREGVFYPPVEQDGYYAGTRYVPVFFVLISGLTAVTGDCVVAAKLAGLLSVVGVLAVVFAAARRVTGRTADGLLLAAVVLAFLEGREALLAPHADALAVALSAGGVALCARERAGKVVLAAAAALFALAVLTKVTSVAGPAAACVWLFWRDRRSALLLAGLTAALTAAGLVAVNVLSEGRFLDNLRAVNSGGTVGELLRTGPASLVYTLKQSARFSLVAPLVLPVAAFVLVRQALEQRFSAWDWYSLFAWATTAVVLAVPGTDRNHLLELEVSAVLVLAAWLRPAEGVRTPATELVARGLVLAALLLALTREARAWHQGPPPDAVPTRVLVDALAGESPVLSEDATVPVLLGRRPVLLDAYSYRVLAEQGRVDARPLAARVRRREFAVVVLLRNLEDPDDPLNGPLTKLHFGPEVTEAIKEAYRFEQRIGPYFIFRPRAAPAETP